ncbi:FAD/NAD(P)-binding oxidoreductase [soil metagenome]
MRRVIICGGGFGGVATAVALRRLVPGDLEILLVDRRTDFVMGLRKIWAALGTESLEVGRRRLADIDGVRVATGEIEAIDPVARRVTVSGQALDADWLVIALGAYQAVDALPGLAEFAINVWDAATAESAQPALAGQVSGPLSIGVFGLPYSCPPAPYELALLARDTLPDAVEVTVFTPAPIALPVLGREQSARLERLLAERGIRFFADRRATTVQAGRVEFDDGSGLDHDLLLAVPPHRCPQLLVAAGLADPHGWVVPDPRTLETAFAGVYAIGDCTTISLANGMAMPKAGALAQAMGETVAARIAADAVGRPPDATFAGEGHCFVEMGRGAAALAGGSFMADPPDIGIGEASESGLIEKREFETSRLSAWFGR